MVLAVFQDPRLTPALYCWRLVFGRSSFFLEAQILQNTWLLIFLLHTSCSLGVQILLENWLLLLLLQFAFGSQGPLPIFKRPWILPKVGYLQAAILEFQRPLGDDFA
jgi:hypothetical protein